jgi:hypothetical protein
MGTTNLDDIVLTGTITAVDAINLEGLATAEDALSVPNVASGGVLAAHTTDAVTHSIRIQSADGTNYYIMCTTTVTNRTGGA